MSNEYTPTTEDVREDLATAHYLDGPQSTYDTIMRYADRIAREAGIEAGADDER